MKNRIAILFFVLLGLFFINNEARAGFGISPPYVKSKNPIFPGAHYEQKITLLRSSADSNMKAKVNINAPSSPEIESWISFNKGEIFDLPKGKLQVPLIVKVDVPDDAVVGDYKGYINIQIMPDNIEGGGVAIALGARVDVDLSITDETFIDFLVRRVDIPDFEQLEKPWSWKIFSWFFYRIKIEMNIENTGNTKIAPSKVSIDVYDLSEKELLESHTDRSIEKIEPFTTKTVYADFPTKLDPGQYWGQIKVYKENEIVHKNKITFTITKPGELKNSRKLGYWPYILMGIYILIILILIVFLVWIRIWRHIFKIIYILLWPLRKFLFLIGNLYKKAKKAFWRWIHKKSSQYQEELSQDEKENEELGDNRGEFKEK